MTNMSTEPPVLEEPKLIHASLARDIADKAYKAKIENERREIAKVINDECQKGNYSTYYDHYIPKEIVEELNTCGYEVEHIQTNYDSYWKISWEGEEK